LGGQPGFGRLLVEQLEGAENAQIRDVSLLFTSADNSPARESIKGFRGEVGDQ
jgi:hypothetical protein